MNVHSPRHTLTPSLLTTALLLAFVPPAAAEDDELAQLLTPQNEVRVGIGYVDKSDMRFGQYNGLERSKIYGLFDVEYLSRDTATGTWISVSGLRLGLDTRELRAAYDRQGDFGVSIDYSRIPRVEPLTFTTGLSGIGTAAQAINGETPRDVVLSTVRDRVTFGVNKRLGERVDVQLRLRQEEKDGARLFGRGTGTFLTEPIDSRTRQFEASVGYTGEQFQVLGGYYATAYNNRNRFIDVATGTDISLAPDNESHQVYVAGGYSITPSTRTTFKLAYSRGRQNDQFFIAPDFPGNEQTSLHGKVETTSAQLGLTARPLPALSLVANVRYEDRDDKTPRHQFLTATTGRDGFNTPFSRTTTAARLEASYRLPEGMQVVGGVDAERRKRTPLSIRQASWRERNDERSYRVELRRSLAETINGSLSYVRSDRDGSDYLPANNNVAEDVIDPLHFADRKRDRVRLSLDWLPTEDLSLQFMVDNARDRYDGRPLGPESGRARFWSVDGTYTVSEEWQLTAFASQDQTRIRQSTITGANGTTVPAQTWQARLRSKGDAAGVGVRGRPNTRLEVGGDVQHVRDFNGYELVATIPDTARLPDITTRHSVLKLFGQYAVSSKLGVRLDFWHDRYRTNDWTWTDWVYADGTTVDQRHRGTVNFVGVSIEYRGW